VKKTSTNFKVQVGDAVMFKPVNPQYHNREGKVVYIFKKGKLPPKTKVKKYWSFEGDADTVPTCAYRKESFARVVIEYSQNSFLICPLSPRNVLEDSQNHFRNIYGCLTKI
jgi:hypothetical protein